MTNAQTSFEVPWNQPHTIEKVSLDKTATLLMDNCDFLWKFADEGPAALEWALREKADISTLRTFVGALKVVLMSADMVAEERKDEKEIITDDGGLVLVKLQ